jgi:hypothetical protein
MNKALTQNSTIWWLPIWLGEKINLCNRRIWRLWSLNMEVFCKKQINLIRILECLQIRILIKTQQIKSTLSLKCFTKQQEAIILIQVIRAISNSSIQWSLLKEIHQNSIKLISNLKYCGRLEKEGLFNLQWDYRKIALISLLDRRRVVIWIKAI